MQVVTVDLALNWNHASGGTKVFELNPAYLFVIMELHYIIDNFPESERVVLLYKYLQASLYKLDGREVAIVSLWAKS